MEQVKTTFGAHGLITWTDEESVQMRYCSGESVYSECLHQGRLLCHDWRDNAVPPKETGECDYLKNKGTPAFALCVDGQDFSFGWQLASHTEKTLENGTVEGTVVLTNTRKALELTVITTCGGDGFFGREMHLKNLSDQPITLTQVSPLLGETYRMGTPYRNSIGGELLDYSFKPYSIGYFRENNWGCEGSFQWEDIPYNVEMRAGSKRGRSGHGHPFMIVRNNLHGGYFLMQLEWSANWQASVECIVQHDASIDWAAASYSIGPVAPAPMRILEAGEKMMLPRVHFGVNHTDFDSLIQSLHRYQRRCVLQPRKNCQPLLFNSSDYVGDAITEQTLKDSLDVYHSLGGELLIVDAGWYGKGLGTDTWYNLTGDWDVNEDRFPNGLEPAFEYARSLGIKIGMWAEVESAGKDSRLAQEHPEWFLHRYGEQVPRLLDLTIPQVRKYVEDTVCSLIERYQLDLFRLDYNTDQLEGGFNNKDGQWENTLYRHVEALWEIFGSLRKKYPNLQLENCSSGGGRTDLGMVRHFTTTWVSDWFKMPRTVRIFNGMTLVLPPEYVDRMFGVCMEGCYEGNFETQLQLAAMSHMTLIGVTPHLAQANPKAMDTVRKYVQIYKEFIRPMHGEMNVYHHTPVLDGLDGNGWCVLEYAHEDRSKGVTCVFRQSRAPGESYRLRMKGLDRGASYRVRMEPEGQIWKTTGERLMEEGLEVRLDTALSSKMFLAEKIEE